MGRIITTLTLEKRNHNGKLLSSVSLPSRSWVKHFFDLLYEPLGYEINTLAAINDITSTGRTLQMETGTNHNPTLFNLLVGAPPGNVMFALMASNGTALIPFGLTAVAFYTGDQIGIQVGTNNAAVTPTDDKLGTKIVHGEGANQLLYGGCELYGLTYANPKVSFSIRRYFTNVAGGAIAVVESGIYSPALTTYTGSYIYCICHDVFGAVTVNNGQILVVVYTVQTTV